MLESFRRCSRFARGVGICFFIRLAFTRAELRLTCFAGLCGGGGGGGGGGSGGGGSGGGGLPFLRTLPGRMWGSSGLERESCLCLFCDLPLDFSLFPKLELLLFLFEDPQPLILPFTSPLI